MKLIPVGLSIITSLTCLPPDNLTAVAQIRSFSGGSTIVGRVFIDRNGDGEQQSSEQGIPRAVILMDDGLQVTTDEYGRFSIPDVSSGYRTGVIDLKSIPGYRIAPNRYKSDRHSSSRTIRITPHSLTRMNFAVIPIK
jgi:hypothetical protein